MIHSGHILATFLGQGPQRIILDLVLLSSVAGYLLFCLIRFRKREDYSITPSAGETDPPAIDLIQDLVEGILGIDSEDHIVYSSRRAEALLGFTADELRMRNYQGFLLLPDGFNESSAQELKSGDRTIGIEHQAWALRKDGNRLNVRVTVTPCRQGSIRALVAIRESQAEPSPALTTTALEPDRLLPTADRIRKFATLLSTSRDLPPCDVDFLKALQESTDHLYADINLFKNLRAIESREMRIDKQPVHLGQWLEKESLSYRQLAEKRGSHLTIPSLKGTGLVLLTDESILSQIYQSLLDFSLTTYQSPSITFHLTHNPANPDRQVRDSKNDSGGLELKVRFLIIVAASTDGRDSKQPRKDETLLESVEADPHIRLARQLLPLIGADLSIDANDFSGLLFQFSLSCQSYGLTRHPALQTEAHPPPAKEETSGTTGKKTGTVLSITEDSNLRKWVREILAAEGFQVEECPPDEVLEKIRDGKKADVVVLQRELSSETDFDLTYEIRQLRKAEDMPILLVHIGEHPDPKISYFCAEDAIDFPAENKILSEKVTALCGLRANP